jgi:4-hydroxy-tetrahydrodipicolinate synthase
VPGRTACDLALETVHRLADLENIVAIKDATGDVGRGLELVKQCGDRLAVLSGEDAISLPLMLGGAAGTISVTANVAPALMSEMCALALSGEVAAATALDQKLALLHRHLFLEANPVPVKWALQKMGWIESGIRLPLVELDRAYHEQVSEALLQAGINLAEAA